MGGGTPSPSSERPSTSGLSPRGRGNPCDGDEPGVHSGSIPAWAGEPASIIWTGDDGTVYPRVGGGTFFRGIGSHATQGLSPRGRGNPILNLVLMFVPGSIPAWAGEPRLDMALQEG